MKIIGIIAEFNPFHNGHDHIMRVAKEMSGADFCVVVMSGDFVQRGEPAICDKYLRTRMALLSSADAVFELPCIYARASAEQFAYGAVLLLSSLGCIDELYFGSESGNTQDLMNIAKILIDEPDEYREVLSCLLKSGLSFPSSREKALKEYLTAKTVGSGMDETVSSLLSSMENGLLSSPNNILAVEYCKAVLRIQASGMKVPSPFAVKRQGSSYDSYIPDTVSDASALAIRNLIKNGRIEAVRPFMPASAYEILSKEYGRSFPIYADDFSSVLYSDLLFIKSLFNNHKYKKVIENSESSRKPGVSATSGLSGISTASGSSKIPATSDLQNISTASGFPDIPCILGIPADLLNAIIKKSDDPLSFSELIETVKTKNVTYSAISRALISILLDSANLASFLQGGTAPATSFMQDETAQATSFIQGKTAPPASFMQDETASMASHAITCARLLGIRKDSSALIRKVSETACCEIINKLADAHTSGRLLETDIRAARLYDQIVYQKFGTRLPDEYRKTIEII